MKVRKKKTPADYPLLSFRLSLADKNYIENEVDRLVTLRNKGRPIDAGRVFSKHIFAEALKIGLKELRRRESIN